MKIKKNLTFNILTIVFCALFLPLSAQTQLGTDIDGEAAGDESGRSVSISSDGSRVAIGAPYNDGTGIDRGHVRIYEYSGSSWTQLGIDINGEADADLSGWSVSLSPDGSRVAIGAPYNNGTGTDAGHVRIYEYSGGSWTQLGIDINGEAAGDESGRSVSLSSDGSRVAIGAPYNDGTGIDRGHVRIYEYSGSSWTQLGIDINGEADADLSGWSVSLSPDGSRVAIGAPYNNGTGTDAGYVRIYEYSGGSWTQFGSDIDGEAAGDESGRSVSLSSDGSRVAIGAYHNDGTGTGAGHVRIFGLPLSSINQIFSHYNVKIYPNPSDGLLHLRDIEADFIRIMDNNGRILFEKHEPLSEIDISNLPNGTYILEVIIDNITIHKKIIKN